MTKLTHSAVETLNSLIETFGIEKLCKMIEDKENSLIIQDTIIKGSR